MSNLILNVLSNPANSKCVVDSHITEYSDHLELEIALYREESEVEVCKLVKFIAPNGRVMRRQNHG